MGGSGTKKLTFCSDQNELVVKKEREVGNSESLRWLSFSHDVDCGVFCQCCSHLVNFNYYLNLLIRRGVLADLKVSRRPDLADLSCRCF